MGGSADHAGEGGCMKHLVTSSHTAAFDPDIIGNLCNGMAK
jgi:hypothetical protein